MSPTACTTRPRGIICPKCGHSVCGRQPTSGKVRRHKSAKGRKPAFVLYTRYQPGAIRRIRVCLRCGQRILTSEAIISNGA